MHRWDMMEAFVRVVEARSFSVAADRLGVSKSLLSKKIAQLERHLGTQLLMRTTRRLNPTDAGHALYEKCERLFSDLEDAEQSILEPELIPRGKLRVVCTDILGEQYIARVAAEMCTLYPALQVEVHVTMRTVDLVAEGYDLAIRYGGLNDSTLRARKVYELPHVVCAAPRYFAKSGRPTSIEELKRHNCLVATFGPCTIWQFKVAGQPVEMELQGNWCSNSGAALITAALAGLGICRLPVLCVRDYLESGHLEAILEEHRSDPLAVWMVYPNARYVPLRTRLFIEYFCNNIDRIEQGVSFTPHAPRREYATVRRAMNGVP